MKKLCVTMLLIATVLCMLSVGWAGAFADVVDDSAYNKFETLAQFKEQERENPPQNEIYWNYFSALGEYVPMSYPTTTYLYLNGDRTYRVNVDTPFAAYDAYKEQESNHEYILHWDRYKDEAAGYSVRKFYEVDFDALKTGVTVWLDPDNAPLSDMTAFKEQDGANTVSVCLDGRLLYRYSVDGMSEICWIYGGYLYRLSVADAQNQHSLPFGDEDIDVIRRLTNTKSCGEALNELMNRLSGDALAEMNKDSASLVGGSENGGNGNDANGDSGKKGMSTTWMFVWGMVGAITFVGIVVIVIDIIRIKRR